MANGGLVVAGLTITALGPALPFLIREYGLSLTLAGTVFGFFAGGRISTVFVSLLIAERFNRKTLLAFGHGGFALGLIGFSLGVTWWMHLVAIAIAGAGYGLTDVLSNAVVAEIYPERRGFALNRLQAYYGVGCILGPVFAAVILGLALSWRLIFAVAAVVALAVTAFTLSTSFAKSAGSRYPHDFPEGMRQVSGVAGTSGNPGMPGRDSGAQGAPGKPSTSIRLGFLRRPALLIPAFAVGMYTGVGNGLIGWINTYFEEMLQAPAVVATIVLLGYNGGITIGRFLGSRYSDRLGYGRTIILNSIAAAVCLGTGALTPSVPLGALSFVLTGLFLAGVAPTAMAAATSLLPNRAGAVSSRMFVFGAGGSLVIPFSMGVAGDLFSLQVGMGVAALLVMTIAPVTAFLSRATARDGGRSVKRAA